MLVIVPDYTKHAIERIVKHYVEDHPQHEGKEQILYSLILDYYDKYGQLPEEDGFTLVENDLED